MKTSWTNSTGKLVFNQNTQHVLSNGEEDDGSSGRRKLKKVLKLPLTWCLSCLIIFWWFKIGWIGLSVRWYRRLELMKVVCERQTLTGAMTIKEPKLTIMEIQFRSISKAKMNAITHKRMQISMNKLQIFEWQVRYSKTVPWLNIKVHLILPVQLSHSYWKKVLHSNKYIWFQVVLIRCSWSL